MDWKVLGGLAAIWSASAGLAVSTGIVSFRVNDIGAVRSFEGGGAAPPVMTVVIDTARSRFTSLPDVSRERGGARCGDALGAGGCVLLPSARGVTLTIFGHTVLLPADGYGFDDGVDAYISGNPPALLPLLGAQGQFIGNLVWAETTGTGSDVSNKPNNVLDQKSEALPVQSQSPLTFQIEEMSEELSPATATDVGPVEPRVIGQPKFVISTNHAGESHLEFFGRLGRILQYLLPGRR